MLQSSKTILGIDPGYGRVGYGVIRHVGTACSHKTAGCIETAPTEASAQRIHAIYTTINNIITAEKPHIIAIEQLFFAKNTKTALRVAETRGVLLLLSQIHAIQLREFTPLQVKLAVCGYGKADKTQVAAMVMRTLQLSALPKPDDASDALAIALTAAFTKEW
jgi:crossover junction endodeoxyribonuclease RuvC